MEEVLENKAQIFRREQEKMKWLAVTYGSALPFQLMMERNMLAQKPKSIQNVNFGLDVSLGRNTKLAFPTYAEERPRFKLDVQSNILG